MPMRPVNFTHYTPIIRFLAEAGSRSRALARRNYTVPRRRTGGGGSSDVARARAGACVPRFSRAAANRAALISTFLACAFFCPITVLSRHRLTAAHLPMVKRVTREAFTDFIAETSVFTFGYNYALMRGESRGKRASRDTRDRCGPAAAAAPLPRLVFYPAAINTLDTTSEIQLTAPRLFRVIPFPQADDTLQRCDK